MTINLAPLQAAARDLDDTALAAWADALEESADAEGATALRALPALLEKIRAAVLDLLTTDLLFPDLVGKTEQQVILNAAGRWSYHWGGFGTSGYELYPLLGEDVWCGQDDAVCILLARWDGMHPAVEWLARRLELPIVEPSYRAPPPGFVPGDSARRRAGEPFDLRRGHLLPLPGATLTYCTLRAPRQ
jgi:hypothetical protein